MTVSSTCTFQLDVPRRPGEADILNGEKENVPPGSSVPPDFPAAEEFNQMGRLCAAYGRMIGLLRMTVTFSSGTPSVSAIASVRDDMAISDITVVDNGVGDVSLTWDAGTFPAPSGQPLATLNTGTTSGRGIDAVNITNGVRIKTIDNGGAADLPFSVMVF